MRDPQQIANRVQYIRNANADRDRDYQKLIAIRKGDYDSVAPGLFDSSEFDKPLVANLVDTTARDIAEVMAPLPGVSCQAQSLASDPEKKRQDLRSAIANGYVQHSRLQDQMFGGADRYGSFGFMALIVEPDFKEKTPAIRIDDVPSAYYVKDYRGRCRQYCAVYSITCQALVNQFPNMEELPALLRPQGGYGEYDPTRRVDVVRWYDDEGQSLVLLDPVVELAYYPNDLYCCPVRIVERPSFDNSGPSGQFDDVIWVQIARALVQMYTLNAIDQAVNAPITLPKDAEEMELGPFSTIQTDTPNAVGRVQLGLPPGLFPEQQLLAQEQRTGSRYPEGRSGNIDASIITGQGVQALMGTFDTQVQTFQRLYATALEDVIAMCFELDEKLWGNVKKTRRIKDNNAPRKFDYTPSKDIAGDYTVDVTYGAIAGLDPNRGLIFVLQALAGGLMSKQTAMKSLPVDMNPVAETQQITLEMIDQSISGMIATLPQIVPQMVAGGMGDPRDLVLQVVELKRRVAKGEPLEKVIGEVFAPKEQEQPAPTPLEQAQGAGEGPAGLPGAGGGGVSDMLMLLAGMSPSGKSNMQANVSRMQPI